MNIEEKAKEILRSKLTDIDLECYLKGSPLTYSACLEAVKEAINYTRCSLELPSKETIISEGEKQIIDWLEKNDKCEKQAYRIGFRRSFEYVLRLMNK